MWLDLASTWKQSSVSMRKLPQRLSWAWETHLDYEQQSQINLKGLKWVGHKHSCLTASWQQCNVTNCPWSLLPHRLLWGGLSSFKRQDKGKPFLEFCQWFGHRRKKVADTETKRMCHQHRVIIMAKKATKRMGTEGPWYRREKERYSEDYGLFKIVKILAYFCPLEIWGDALLFVWNRDQVSQAAIELDL